MNVITDTATGPVCMTTAEADACIAYLRRRLSHAERDEQLRLSEAIRNLELVTNPELAYGERFAPRDYEPGWVPAA